jgi:dihydroxy-acid dehydratase
VGVINSFSEIIPGHIHLRQLAEAVKAGIRAAAGTPFECSTIGVCDGIAMNHLGMKFSLPSRELIADSVEVVAQAHAFDALVLITNCDKIIPGMLMAAARLNIPTIAVSGGPMLAGRLGNRLVDLADVFMAVGAVTRGEMTEEELERLERVACPGCGSCAGMFTANTMNCLTEALGMGLPGNGTIPAVHGARIQLAKQAGQQVMDLLAHDVKPLDILTEAAFRNAFVVDMALGGSTNSILHLLAIAHEAGISVSLAELNDFSAGTPHLCKMSPAAGGHHLEELNAAGGIPAVMGELLAADLLDGEALTVTGKRLAENLAAARVRDRQVIRSLDDPYSVSGGLAILFGNLAPQGAVVKQAVVAPQMLIHRGPARVFDAEEDATQAIMDGRFEAGDVLVIRYEGPRGGPGMREMLTPTSLLSGMGLDDRVALLTDGRFSGATPGCWPLCKTVTSLPLTSPAAP